MAQAADVPIGFHAPAKVPDLGTFELGDSDLAELQAWQASPAGMAEADVVCLVSTIADLKQLAAKPLGLRLLALELADLKLVYAEVGQLISRLYRARELAA